MLRNSKGFRELSAEQVKAEFNANIPQDFTPASTFWDSYNAAETTTGLRACILLCAATYGQLVPQEFQLQATISLRIFFAGKLISGSA